jgi:hypothetical protein
MCFDWRQGAGGKGKTARVDEKAVCQPLGCYQREVVSSWADSLDLAVDRRCDRCGNTHPLA